MLRRTPLAILLFTAALHAQAPAEDDPSHILAEARHAAINYTKWLPDFICTELVHRFEAMGPTNPFRGTDTLTLQLTYFQLHENYKLVARNNRPTKQSLESVGGAQSQGEFGSKLLLIYHPQSKTEFAFKEWGKIGARRVAVFTYRVDRANSRFELRSGTEATVAGYHGEVFVDATANQTLRITEEVDVPTGFPVEFSRNTSDYATVDVGGHPYLLPVRCETFGADSPPTPRNGRSFAAPSLSRQVRYRNVIEFRDYRKYQAESTLSFDTPEGPPKL